MVIVADPLEDRPHTRERVALLAALVSEERLKPILDLAVDGPSEVYCPRHKIGNRHPPPGAKFPAEGNGRQFCLGELKEEPMLHLAPPGLCTAVLRRQVVGQEQRP